jgi:hypothetical protein
MERVCGVFCGKCFYLNLNLEFEKNNKRSRQQSYALQMCCDLLNIVLLLRDINGCFFLDLRLGGL